MKTLVLRTPNSQLRVEVKVDMIREDDNFTIMTIEGVTDSAALAGIDLKELPTTLATMKEYAVNRNLLLEIYDTQKGEITEVIDSVIEMSIETSGAMEEGEEGEPYSQQVEVAGGNSPFTFEVTDGVLPDGLTLLSTNGIIHGVPTTAGTQTFEITVTDAFGQSEVESGLEIEIKRVGAQAQ